MADRLNPRPFDRPPAPLLAEVAPATTPYRVEWRPSGRLSTVQPTAEGGGRDRSLGRIRPGSLLAVAIGCGESLPHVCGGLASCGTCAIRVLTGGESLPPPEEIELRTLAALRSDENRENPGCGMPRLACQCIPDGSSDLVVEIPAGARAIPARSD